MKTYSPADIAQIAAFSPNGAACRVSSLRHRFGEHYEHEGTHFFPCVEEGLHFCTMDGEGEVDLPEHYGTAAYSRDGKRVKLLTVFSEGRAL